MTVRIVSICGSLRAGSVNAAVLRTAASVAPATIGVKRRDDLAALPHFDPDVDHEPLPTPVARLRSSLAAAHAVLFCTPEYAGALPGSFKNLLDWTVGGPEMYRKPVAWINASASPTGALHAHDSLRTVLGYLHSDIVASACVHIPVPRDRVGADGLIADAGIRARIASVLTTLAEHVNRHGKS